MRIIGTTVGSFATKSGIARSRLLAKPASAVIVCDIGRIMSTTDEQIVPSRENMSIYEDKRNFEKKRESGKDHASAIG